MADTQTAARFARAVAATIARRGSTVTLADATTIKAIVDERPEEISKVVPQDIYDSLEGRPALFNVTAADAERIPKGTTFTYDGQKWKVHPFRPTSSADTKILVNLLATAGAIS